MAVSLIPLSVALAAAQDEFVSRQWGFKRVRAEAAWTAGRGAGTTIAIVDTGVDLKHPDLKGAIVRGHDFVDDDTRPMDENGHGTHVAGIAAADDNDIGVAGVAPDAKIMPVRVLNRYGRGSGSDVEAGVRWAVDHGADIINLSLSDNVVIEGLSRGTMTELAAYAWSKGAITVIAAGNGGLFRTDPSDAKAVLVTATTVEDEQASYATSVGFADWGIAAPGGDSSTGDSSKVFSTYWSAEKGSGYGWGVGTSQATPHVSGAAAILRGRGLTPQQTVDRLLRAAKDIGSEGDDFTYGHGLLDVGKAADGLAARAPASPDRVEAPVRRDKSEPSRVAAPPAAPKSERSAPAAVAKPEPAEPKRTPAAPPGERIVASDEVSTRSAMANLFVGASLLGVAAVLVGYGSFRRVRARG